jgi:hypothetical protein
MVVHVSSGKQSAVPSKPTRQAEQLGQRVVWQASAAQAPVSATHRAPVGQAPTQRFGAHAPVCGSHVIPPAQATVSHGEGWQLPFTQA